MVRRRDSKLFALNSPEDNSGAGSNLNRFCNPHPSSWEWLLHTNRKEGK